MAILKFWYIVRNLNKNKRMIMFYKGYYIWYNELQKVWHIQVGYEILKSVKTLGVAKSWVTKLNKN